MILAPLRIIIVGVIAFASALSDVSVNEPKEEPSAEARSFSLNDLGLNFGALGEKGDEFAPLEHYPLWKIHKYHGVDLKPVHLGLELGKKKKDAVPFTPPPPLLPPSQDEEEKDADSPAESFKPPMESYGPPPSKYGVPSLNDQPPSQLALQGLAHLDTFGSALGALQGDTKDEAEGEDGDGFTIGGAIRGFTSGLTSIPSFLQGLIGGGGQSGDYPPPSKNFFSTGATRPVPLPSLPQPPELPSITSLGALPNVPQLPPISLPPGYRSPYPPQQLPNAYGAPMLSQQLPSPRYPLNPHAAAQAPVPAYANPNQQQQFFPDMRQQLPPVPSPSNNQPVYSPASLPSSYTPPVLEALGALSSTKHESYSRPESNFQPSVPNPHSGFNPAAYQNQGPVNFPGASGQASTNNYQYSRNPQNSASAPRADSSVAASEHPVNAQAPAGPNFNVDSSKAEPTYPAYNEGSQSQSEPNANNAYGANGGFSFDQFGPGRSPYEPSYRETYIADPEYKESSEWSASDSDADSGFAPSDTRTMTDLGYSS